VKNWLPALLWLGSMLGVDLFSQTCATLNLAPNAYTCQSNTAQSYTLSGYDAGNTYSFQLISGSALIDASGIPVVNITWHSPGDIVFVMNEIDITAPIGTCSPDTFRVRVGALFAPQVNCNDTVNISLDETCNGLVTPDMVIEGSGFDFRDYNVVIRDLVTKVTIPTSPRVNSTHLGKLYEVSIVHRCSGNSCWGILRVEDKLPPRMTCRSLIVNCGAGTLPTDPGVGFPRPSGAPNPVAVPGRPRTFTSSSSSWDNCGFTTLTYTDRLVQVDCPPAVPFIDTIFRSWTAVDGYGNDTTCIDTILIRAGSIATITCPPSYDGLNGNPSPLACDGNFQKDANGNPHPSVTGFPSGVNCRNINYTYNDIRLGVCAGSYKILREWFIADWCTGEDTTCIQLIKVIDDRGPIIACPGLDTIYTLPHSCSSNHELGLPRTLVPECSNPLTYDLVVKRGVPDPTVTPNSLDATTEGVFRRMNGSNLLGFRVENLPVGLNWLVYKVTDACGNMTECATEVYVKETTKPTPVCHFETIVTLTDDGWAKIYAHSFNDGSHDNCELDSFKVMRMDPSPCGGKGNRSFDDYIEFCCSDVSATTPVIVRLLVTDKAGNTNECMVRVFVHDKKPPVVTCLPNITVSCLYDYTDLNKFGYYRTKEEDRKNIIINDPSNTSVAQPRNWGRDGLVIEDCNLRIDSAISHSINNCGVGFILRRYDFRDSFNAPVSCFQTITINNYTSFTGSSIVWPVDTTLTGCLDQIDTARTGSPRWPGGLKCSNILATYEDEVFNQVDNVCFKVLRKWTVIDWCNFNSRTGAGKYSRVQVIKVVNKDKPRFTSACTNVSFDVLSSDCNGQVSLTASAADYCGNTRDLAWSYRIDLNNNGSVDINGASNDASGIYPVGSHRITWIVEDRCGNSETCTYLFTLNDRKQPTPVCRSGIITVIMPTTGAVTIWAKDLNISSFDNCTPAPQLRYSFTTNPANDNRLFTCAQIPDGVSQTFDIRIYVTDLAGNQDFCDTKVIIQDGLGNACPDNLGGGGTTATATISGTISTEQSAMLEEAMVSVTGNMPSLPKYHMTRNDGKYVFAALPLSENYILSAEKNDDMLNGVTTNDIVIIQKHILGIQSLDNPYKFIAADVNNSRSITARDISDLRKLILGISEVLPAGKSWVFVNSDQKFKDPSYPWPIEDALVLEKINGDLNEKNFIAVKLGDVNNTAATSQLTGMETRSDRTATLLLGAGEFESDKEVMVPVYLNGVEGAVGLQAELRFDAESIEFLDIRSGSVKVDMSNLNSHLLSEGVLRFSIDHASGANTKEALFYLVFSSKVNGKLNESVYLADKGLPAEAYNNSGESFDLNLRFESGSENVNEGLILYQNRPNPFSTVTDISFYLPKEGEASLKICDLNGKVLRQIIKRYGAGLHTIQLNNKDIEQSGILYYILETSGHRAVKKMILIK
jgi:hypothetical protein